MVAASAASPSFRRFAQCGSVAIISLLILVAAAGVNADFRTSTAALRAASVKPTASLSAVHPQFEDVAPLRAVLDSLPSVHGDNTAPEIVLDAMDITSMEFSSSGSGDYSASFSDSFSESFSESMSMSGESGSFSYSEEMSFSDMFSFSESGLFSDFSGSDAPPSMSFSESFSESFSLSDEMSFSDFSGSFSDFSGSGGASMSLSGDGMTCFPNPCENGGTCEYDLDNDKVTCECTREWDGEFCQSAAAPSSIEDLVLDRGVPSSEVLIAKWSPATRGAEPIMYTLHFGRADGTDGPLGTYVVQPSDFVGGRIVVPKSSLEVFTEYEAFVVASNGIGYANSNTVRKFTTTVGPSQMAAPSILHASAYWIDLQWSRPQFPEAVSEIDRYVITFNNIDTNETQQVNTTNTDTWYRVMNADGSNFAIGDTFEFQITAVDTKGVFGVDSPMSELATTSLGAPWGLSNLTVTARTLDSLSLSWSEPWDLNTESLADTTFTFYLTSTVGSEIITVSADVVGELEVEITGLKSGRAYSVVYEASNINGISDVNANALSVILPVTPPKIVSFKASDSVATPSPGLTTGDRLTITFDKATNMPTLTTANLANYVVLEGQVSTSVTMTPTWESATVLRIRLVVGSSPSGYGLGKVTATVGGSSIGLAAAASIGGSAAAAATSGPLAGNFGFASTLLELPDASTAFEDVPVTFAELNATLLTAVSSVVVMNIQPYVAGSTVTSGGSTGTSTTPLVLTGLLTDLVSQFEAIVYTSAPNYNGMDIITIDIQVGGAQVYFDAVVADVHAVNDAPVLTVASLSASANVDQEFTISGTSVVDVDSVLNTNAAVTAAVITSDALHSCRFGATRAGVIFVPAFVSGTQPMRQKITAYGKVADVSAALANIKCSFGLADPTDISSPTVSITINDGANGADARDLTAVPAVAGADVIATVSCVAATLAAPTLIFANDATSILVVFPVSVIINTPDSQSCSSWFDSASVIALGAGAECYGVGLENGRNTIQAVLGKGATISPSGSLTLLQFKRCESSTNGYAGSTLTVAAPVAPVKPTIAVDAPAQVAQCADFGMAAFAAGVSDRLATYSWSSSPAGLFAGSPTTPAVSVTGGKAVGIYTVTVSVTNFVGARSEDTVFTVEVVAKSLADIRVTGPRVAVPSQNGQLSWRAAAELPKGGSCTGTDSLAFSFEWSTDDTTLQAYLLANGLTTGTTLIVPASEVTSLKTFTIYVKGTEATDATNVATTSFTLVVGFGMPVFSSAGYVSAFTSAPTSFTWRITSYRSAAYGVTYRSAITCKAPGGAKCVSTSGILLYPETPIGATATLALLRSASAGFGRYESAFGGAGNGTVSLAANSLAPGVYTFTLITSYSPLPNQYTSSNVVLALAPPPVVAVSGRRLLAAAISGKPVMTLSCSKGCSQIASPPIVSAGQLLAFGVSAAVQSGTTSAVTLTEYSWEITPAPRGGVTGVSFTSAFFTLNPNSVSNYFVQGATYNIAVTVTLTLANGARQQGTAYQQIQVNQPPRSGSLTVPTTNTENVAITLQAPGWFDSNGGLQYQFYTRNSAGVRRDISSLSSSPRYVWEYPVAGTPTRTVGVAVNDVLGATTLSETVVTITKQTYDATTTPGYVTGATTTQSAKGNTEGLNQLSVQVGQGAADIADSSVAQSVRAKLLANIADAAKTTSASAYSATVQSGLGSINSQITVATAIAACNELSVSLATLDSNTRSSLATSTVNSAVAIGNQIITAVISSTPASAGRRLLAAGSDVESTKASINATYAMLLNTLTGASKSVLVNPGQTWESNQTSVDVMATRFLTSDMLTVTTKPIAVAGVLASVTVEAEAQIVAVAQSRADIHVIYEAPNPFTWYSSSLTIVGASVLVRYADTTNGVATGLTADKITKVTIPFDSSLCPRATCTATCIMWVNNDWTTTGVSIVPSMSTTTTQQCSVASSVGSSFTISVKYAAGGVIDSSSSTGTNQGTTIAAAMVLKIAATALPTTFDVDFVDNLATFAASTLNGAKADFLTRFAVKTKAAATTSTSKVSFSIYDSATGATAQGIYNALAAAIKAGTGSGTYLSIAESLTMTCTDGVERSTCSTTGDDTSSGSSMGAIIGGVVGGVGFIIIVVLAVVCYRKSRPPKIHDSSAHGATTDPSATNAVA